MIAYKKQCYFNLKTFAIALDILTINSETKEEECLAHEFDLYFTDELYNI